MTQHLLPCLAAVVALAVGGCGSSGKTDSTTAGRTVTALNGRVSVVTPAEEAAQRIMLDAYRANVAVSDFCGAIVNDNGPRDVRELSHAVDALIDFHRDANNEESRGLLRDAAAMLRDCSDFAGDRAGTDAADRLTAAVDGQ